MAPKLPAITIGDHVVAVDRISGHGNASATLAITRLTPTGKPSREVDRQSVTRAELTAYALELLDLSEAMVHHGAYSSSISVPDRHQLAMVARRKQEAVLQYFRIEDRLPILQMCQRLLESCSDAMAKQLLLMMSYAQTQGRIPVNFDLQLNPAVDADIDSGTKH